ncbi:hypothetical protein [Thalassotalea sp. PP2-459]|uniref:hypothetical protein n=1 Tax=Thalassotalea sp. PP2-459 TaxID=1742724 RepID=UPI0009456E10|nr:hypothetical protein [Thalassotalea sp. PP2-459]OKY27126.1 hypothetical protein BI291_18010 [Thalassotalea sp. PP2-459]
MKEFLYLILCLFVVTNCYANSQRDELQLGEIVTKAKTLRSKTLPNHFLSCLANTTSTEASYIEDIVTELTSLASVGEKQNVILYFHGGLSPQEYMVNDLGPVIYQYIHKNKLDLYPIFVQYHAGVFDFVLASDAIKKLVASQTFSYLVDYLTDKISDNTKSPSLFKINGSIPQTKAAHAYLYQLLGQPLNQNTFSYTDNNSEMSENELKLLMTILNASSIDEIAISNKGLAIKTDSRLLNEAAYLIHNTTYEFQGFTPSNPQAVLFDSNNEELSTYSSTLASFPTYKLRILRFLARMSLGSHHGLDTTIAEEVIDTIPFIVKPAQTHWEKVKLHAKECYRQGNNGANLITKLSELKKNNKISSVNLMSHSAGSIPISELVKYANKNKLQQIDHIAMVVPAINQKLFKTNIIKNSSIFDRLDIYPLTKRYEIKDDIFLPGSLLYWVSSIGDKAMTLDRTLLLNQHLAKKFPYSNWLYRNLADEKQIPDILKFITKDNIRVQYYPFCTNKDECSNEGATHSGTKIPKESPKLAKCVFNRFLQPAMQCIKS